MDAKKHPVTQVIHKIAHHLSGGDIFWASCACKNWRKRLRSETVWRQVRDRYATLRGKPLAEVREALRKRVCQEYNFMYGLARECTVLQLCDFPRRDSVVVGHSIINTPNDEQHDSVYAGFVSLKGFLRCEAKQDSPSGSYQGYELWWKSTKWSNTAATLFFGPRSADGLFAAIGRFYKEDKELKRLGLWKGDIFKDECKIIFVKTHPKYTTCGEIDGLPATVTTLSVTRVVIPALNNNLPTYRYWLFAGLKKYGHLVQYHIRQLDQGYRMKNLLLL